MQSKLGSHERFLIENPDVDCWLSSLPRGGRIVKQRSCTGTRFCPCDSCVEADKIDRKINFLNTSLYPVISSNTFLGYFDSHIDEYYSFWGSHDGL